MGLFADDEARPPGPVLSDCGRLGGAVWQVKELEQPDMFWRTNHTKPDPISMRVTPLCLQLHGEYKLDYTRLAVAHFLPELRPRLADPRRVWGSAAGDGFCPCAPRGWPL